MGVRKRLRAEAIKESKKSLYFAKLNDCPTSPRKMRLVADMIRGLDAYKALNLLRFTPKEAARRMEKLLASALANYEAKAAQKVGDEALHIKEVFVDGGRQLKRLRPAPQGRGHRIRKRSNHVTLILANVANS